MKYIVAGIAGLMLMSGFGQATEYFVDAENGDDTRSGISPATAWKTLVAIGSKEIKPGDTVRLKRGSVWREGFSPVSGTKDARVTYTSYGEGDKPLLLRSIAADSPKHWEEVKPGIWATAKAEWKPAGKPIDYRQSDWRVHQEKTAVVKHTKTETPEGISHRIECINNGTAQNHIQLWGGAFDWEWFGTAPCFTFRFRCRSSKEFTSSAFQVLRGGSPWSGQADGGGFKVKSEWQEHTILFSISSRGKTPKLHLNFGDVLPEGAVFEFCPIELTPVSVQSQLPMFSVDIGNIIFDHGPTCGWKKWSVETLTNPLDYVFDRESMRVFLRCEQNPAVRFKSIEMAQKKHIISQSNAKYVTYDGLALRYGAAHGFGGGSTANLIIRNCDISYIGGGHQLTRANGRQVRFGNGIEFWGACRDNLVEGCRIWEIYDAALTNQGRGPTSKQINITYRNNIIWNSEYSFEYWNNPETAETRNIRFVNNTCVDAGVVWSHAQRPDPNGSHLMMYSNRAKTSGIEIKYNVFCQSTDWTSRFTAGWKPMPDMDYNLCYETGKHLCFLFRDKLPATDIAGYQEKTGFDKHSVFADPKFVDPANRDYRLQPDSPARNVRPDGGIVGAESLWQAAEPK
jgi:hypothetical protein